MTKKALKLHILAFNETLAYYNKPMLPITTAEKTLIDSMIKLIIELQIKVSAINSVMNQSTNQLIHVREELEKSAALTRSFHNGRTR